MSAHPFPPVVRWALFPALAGLAGAAAGALGTRMTEPSRLTDWTAIAGGLATAGAFAFALSRRGWIACAAAPVLGALMSAAALALVAGGDAWALLQKLVREPGGVFLIGLSSISYAAAFAFAGPSWLRNAAVFGAAALVSGLLSGIVSTSWALVAALSIAVQIAPYRAALAIAGRMRRTSAFYTE